MALTTDIAAMYRTPRAVMRRKLAVGPREDRALMYLFLACALIFVAQWPRLRREALLDDAVPFDARLGGSLLAWIFLAPLVFYGIAALSRAVARIFGGKGSGYSARLALFWSLLAAAPVWLLYGLVAGFVGPGIQMTIAGLLALGVFLLFWGLSLIETETGGTTK